LINIYSRKGYKLAELDHYFRRTWKLNEYSEASFKIAVTDLAAEYEYLKYGNLVYVTHDKLPAWGGTIVGYDWLDFKHIEVKCYSAEWLLNKRCTPKKLSCKAQPGAVVRKILNNIYPPTDPLPLKAGAIYGDGDVQEITYNYEILYDAITTLAENTGFEWDVLPVEDSDGLLHFEVNWYQQRGSYKDYALDEDSNLELNTKPMRNQGEIKNYIIGYGKGATWEDKRVSEQFDQASIDEVGLEVDVVSFEDCANSQLKSNTYAQLQASKQQRRTFDVNALDHEDTFYQLDRGNILPVKSHNMGFDGGEIGTDTDARILGMTYDHENNKVELVMDEYYG
jgi:hypothetical protein